jgi:hypothetical protein
MKRKGKLMTMSMGYLIRIYGSPFWQARFLDKSGVEVQRSTKTRDKRQAEAILAAWALQAHLERQPDLCRARVRRVSAEMSRLVGGDTTPVATYQAARDAFLARPMDHPDPDFRATGLGCDSARKSPAMSNLCWLSISKHTRLAAVGDGRNPTGSGTQGEVAGSPNRRTSMPREWKRK